MNDIKPIHWVGIALGCSLILYVLYHHLQYFGNVSFLGGALLLEILIVGLWKFRERFFVLLMISFVWAGMNVPMQVAGTIGRWVFLSAGAVVGFIIWAKTPTARFRTIHLTAFFCVCAAFVSATVSSFIQMASSKALSLCLLFLYCVSGARLSVLGREGRFFRGVLWGAEIAVYGSAICYFALGLRVWGNPNSLGAVMSVAIFPILLWGWLTTDGTFLKTRRLVALLLSTYLIYFSMARAGMASATLVTLVFCFCLRQYKLLAKTVAIVLVLISISGMLVPQKLYRQLGEISDAFLYKGHKQEGLLGSRLTPWQNSISSIKEHPIFGTGYGTSPTGEDPGAGPGRFSSSAEEEREHGSSYITIVEWVGLVGVVPFLALLFLVALNVWNVCAYMRRTGNPRHYSIPLAMVVLAGLVHAGFEDSLFAVGSYLSVWVWVLAFMLADLVPDAQSGAEEATVSRSPQSFSIGYGVAYPNR